MFVCDNGRFYKCPSSVKGPLASEPTVVLHQSKLSSLPNHPLVAVWSLDEGVYANVIPWDSLTKTTSKGKTYLPEGAELMHLGDAYTLKMSGRKKDKELNLKTLKPRPVGGKGTKIANLTDTE